MELFIEPVTMIHLMAAEARLCISFQCEILHDVSLN